MQRRACGSRCSTCTSGDLSLKGAARAGPSAAAGACLVLLFTYRWRRTVADVHRRGARAHTENIEVRGVARRQGAVNPAIVLAILDRLVAARGRLAAILGPAVGSAWYPRPANWNERRSTSRAVPPDRPANNPRHICQTALGAQDQGVAHAAAQWTGCVVHLQRAAARARMHITSISIYDPSTAPGGSVTFKGILALSRRQVAPGQGVPSEGGARSRRP